MSPACPLIISASRATDIPAFFPDWFIERLELGYAERRNPYNGQLSRLNFSRARAVVFWTKNPAPLLPHLKAISRRGLKPLFLFTVNDYEAEGWEPHLPPLARRLEIFARLAEQLEPGSVAWRFDPIALGPNLGPEELLSRLDKIHHRLAPYTSRLIFSFIELYPKVTRRLRRLGLDLRRPGAAEAETMLKHLAGLSSPGLKVSACAQDIGDPAAYGLAPGRCLEAEWLCGLVPELRGRPELFRRAPGLFSDDAPLPVKDPGQRPLCGCLPSRDIGAYGTCRHGCVYCYAMR